MAAKTTTAIRAMAVVHMTLLLVAFGSCEDPNEAFYTPMPFATSRRAGFGLSYVSSENCAGAIP